MEACKRDNLLHFTQEVTDEVIAFLHTVPEIRGMRQGDIVYEVKEPYQTKQYLAETNPVLKRYHYCHCPWAREAIKRGNVKLVPTFFNCSAGYHKRRWEVIFGQPLKAVTIGGICDESDCAIRHVVADGNGQWMADFSTFGFVSKYQKGASVPTGNTEFLFQVASLNFKSISYDWLVIAGTKAQYKGTGTINGAGNYAFMLTAIDGTPDKFRIKI